VTAPAYLPGHQLGLHQSAFHHDLLMIGRHLERLNMLVLKEGKRNKRPQQVSV
jgi:hypothetical protein